MKISGKADISEEEKARRASEYEPWRVTVSTQSSSCPRCILHMCISSLTDCLCLQVKDMKPDWKSLAEKAETLAGALEADEAGMRELTEVLCTNVAQDRTRLLLDDETPPQSVSADQWPPMALFAQRPQGAGKFRAAIWREPTWQVLARCNAGGTDAGDAYKFLAESFQPLNLVSNFIPFAQPAWFKYRQIARRNCSRQRPLLVTCASRFLRDHPPDILLDSAGHGCGQQGCR